MFIPADANPVSEAYLGKLYTFIVLVVYSHKNRKETNLMAYDGGVYLNAVLDGQIEVLNLWMDVSFTDAGKCQVRHEFTKPGEYTAQLRLVKENPHRVEYSDVFTLVIKEPLRS